jgi:pectate lyase C
MSGGGSGGNASTCTPTSNVMCGGTCVDPQSSEQHCGGCGKACASGQQCESGKCECSGDLDLCSSKCVDTETDEQNCGSCGKVCASGQECDGGSCACTGDLELCSAACVNTDNDEQNCGSCGNKCASGQTCESGQCTGGSTGTTCSSITDFGTVSETIVVKNGQTYDGQCRRYRADADKLGDGSQKEGQLPVFIVENGGKLINVVLGAPAADGIHTKGSVTLENITWEDIGEDAMTIKEGGTVILNGGSAKNGEDKVFQINAASTFRISNFKASNAGKFIRQNGGTTFKAQVFIDKCDISDMDEAIFRTDSSTSTVSMTNTRYHSIGDSLFIGVSSGNITQSNNTAY